MRAEEQAAAVPLLGDHAEGGDTDGELENRSPLLLETVRTIVERWPQPPDPIKGRSLADLLKGELGKVQSTNPDAQDVAAVTAEYQRQIDESLAQEARSLFNVAYTAAQIGDRSRAVERGPRITRGAKVEQGYCVQNRDARIRSCFATNVERHTFITLERWRARTERALAMGTVESVGAVLYTGYLLPFEITSILIMIAILGAVVLASRPEAVAKRPHSEKPESAPELAGAGKER